MDHVNPNNPPLPKRAVPSSVSRGEMPVYVEALPDDNNSKIILKERFIKLI